MEGGTLRKLIKAKEEDLPWSRRLKIALDVSQGMSYLHSKEVRISYISLFFFFFSVFLVFLDVSVFVFVFS